MKIDSKVIKMLGLVSHLGITMIVPIVMCIYIGVYLDEKFNTGAIFLVIFTLLGILAAFRNMYYLVMKMSEDKDKK
ncbi:MAG: AtpZ/AtpI family protein [Clostridia bacterium]|nr:AtpZ/AtpI family protein [Clostridia bacterium]